MEQARQPAHLAGAGRVAVARGVAGLGEQAADQLVGHVQHRIGQACLKVEDGGDQDRAAPACGIAAELMGVGGVALAHELPQPLLIDPRGDFGRQADVAYPPQPVEQFAHVVRLRGDRIALSQANGVMSTAASRTSSRSSLAVCSSDTPASRASVARRRGLGQQSRRAR